MKYISIPQVVEAIQLDLSKYKPERVGVLEFIVIHDRTFLVLFDSKSMPHIIIPSEHGNEMARHKDWVIKDENTKLSVCLNCLFKEKYDKI